MPTIPAAPGQEPHQQRHMAESFGADAERYDRSRPRYPQELIDRIAGRGREVLDVGTGTGIAARQLQAAGCTVLGVEPDPRMAAWAREQGLTVEVSAFETWDPAGRTFDAVVAGQAWHWVDPVAGAARAADVLRPGGVLALFWNVYRLPRDLAEASAEVYRRVMPDSLAARWATAQGAPSAQSAQGTQSDQAAADPYGALVVKVTDALRQTGAFGEPEQWSTGWEQRYTRDEWLDQVPTQGGAVEFPPDKLAEVLTGIGAAIDGMGGSIVMGYTTVAVTATRLDYR